MKITAKRSPDCKHDRYPSIDLLAPVRSRRGEREVEDGSSDSYQPSSESTDGDDRLQDLGDRSSTVVPDRQSPRVRQKRDRAQNELQYIDSDVEGEKVKAKVEHELDSGSDPYAQDRQGIALLLQAADVVESRERAQNRSIGYDGEAAVVGEDAADRSSSPSTEDSDETSPDDASESQGRKVPLPSKRERVQKSKRPTTKKRPLPIPSERTNKRRRSERLIAASSSRVRHLRSKTHFCHSSSAEHEPKRPSNRRKHIHPTITVDATTQTDPATCANETVRARIAAIDAYHAALSRGQARPNWNQYPGVREYIQEQRARARERRRWLDRHQGGEGGRGLAQGEEEGEEEGDEGEEEEEEYDEGVEGGFWVYSQSSSEQGQGGNDKAGERKRILAAKDSQGEDVDQGEDEDEDEDPIMGPGARRCGHSRYVVVVDDVDNDDDGADDSEAARR